MPDDKIPKRCRVTVEATLICFKVNRNAKSLSLSLSLYYTMKTQMKQGVDPLLHMAEPGLPHIESSVITAKLSMNSISADGPQALWAGRVGSLSSRSTDIGW